MKAATITVNGKAIGFVARKADYTDDHACKGCLFDASKTEVCDVATAAAREAGQPDCGSLDDGFIYVRPRTRQPAVPDDVLP